MFDAKTFFEDNNVPIGDSYSKHAQQGWVQVECPFCTGNPGYHLGFNTAGGYFNCWRCKWHSTIKVIQAFTNCSLSQAKQLEKQYKLRSFETTKQEKRWGRVKEVKYPATTGKLQQRHKNYLIKRKYNPEKLIKQWDLKATGILGNYKHRIIAPIYFNKKLVSFQGRDITDKSALKYKACKQDNEIILHQNIVYGYDKAIEFNQCILVEGITDVWRLGKGAVSCFGTATTPGQLNLLSTTFNKIYILFDEEIQAQIEAGKLESELLFRGNDVEILHLESGDPGEMKQTEANQLMKKLGF